MYDLTRFTLADMTECGSALRKAGDSARSMEEAAGRVVGYLRDHLVDKQTGAKVCALVRFYKTHPYGALPEELRRFADSLASGYAPSPEMKCLALLATAGDQPEWDSRRQSVGHQAIPLPSEAVVSRIPMIAQLVKQFGLEISSVLQPTATLLAALEQRTYNVFHVQDAAGSPHVPAQDGFVVPHRIKSVLGFGGMLPSGDLCAVIMFSKVRIPPETADLFKTLALSVKMAVLPFAGGPIFV